MISRCLFKECKQHIFGTSWVMNRTGITMLLALVSFPCRISYQADYSKYDVNGEQIDCSSGVEPVS